MYWTTILAHDLRLAMDASTTEEHSLTPDQRSALSVACRELIDGATFHLAVGSLNQTLRRRVLTAEVMCLAIIHLVVAQCRSLLHVIDELRLGTVVPGEEFEVTGAAFYKRMRVLKHELFLNVLREVTKTLDGRGGPVRENIRALAPFATRICALDDTTLDALTRRTEVLKSVAPSSTALLAGRLGCLIDLTTQRFVEVLYDSDPAANEKSHLVPLIENLPPGALLVMDLGYFAFPLFDVITKKEQFFISRMRKKTTYRVVRKGADTRLYRDSLIELGVHRADRAAHPVRLVELFIDGQWHQYITNVLQPERLRADAIWQLYKHRWTIEKAFAALKRALGAAWLHCCHQNGFLLQIWATLTVYQVLQALRLDAAASRKMDVEEISWVNLLRRVSMYASSPIAGTTLRSWLCDPRRELYLAKRGVRQHSRQGLDPPLIADIRAFATEWDTPPPRKPRQGKPEPRTKKSEVIIAHLLPTPVK